MNSEKINNLIESAITDLSNNEGLSKILLKAQVISHHLKNEKFSTWLNNEMHGGYISHKDLPAYRISSCEVFGNITRGNGMLTNFKIATGLMSNAVAKEMATTFEFFESITEIEDFAAHQSTLKKHLSSDLLFHIAGTLTSGWTPVDAWQITSSSTCKGIVETFKSKLLQFFLELNEQFEVKVNFNVMSEKKQIDKIVGDTIYAGIVNTGQNSPINITNSQVVSGSNNQATFSTEMKNEVARALKVIQDSLEIFGDSQDEIASEIERVKVQIAKDTPKAGIIKSSFEIMKAIFIEVVATGTTPTVIEWIHRIINLLG